MKLALRIRPEQPTTDEPTDRPETTDDNQPIAHATEWTGGPALAARAVTVLGVVALVCGPVAVGVIGWSWATSSDAAPTTVDQVDLVGSSVAGDAGRAAVAAWLSATNDDHAALDRIYPNGMETLPEEALPVRAVTVASVDEAGPGQWTVVVGADVTEPSGEDGATAWVRRYYQVPVVVAQTATGPGTAATALPSPIAGPSLLAEQPSGFSDDLGGDQALTETVAGFLGSHLAGDGDIERYLSPGTVIAPLDPPAYTSVAVDSVLGEPGDATDSESPADGDALRVLVAATLTRPDGQQTTAQYVLDLEARAGRWEITEIPTSTTRPDQTPTPEGDL
ncbi:conjugal transfer protein [Isoptericola sp. NPDC056578]|uniref:conjugal transfer protein n=1 Tax=Isoptericola sp. NPDC056578 TaxID=3345870 RepID=UPI0036B88DA7